MMSGPTRDPRGQVLDVRLEPTTASQGMQNVRIEGTSEIQEIRVLGDWAYLRNYIEMTMTTGAGEPMRRSGYTLTIMRRESDGRWRLARDANLLASDN